MGPIKRLYSFFWDSYDAAVAVGDALERGNEPKKVVQVAQTVAEDENENDVKGPEVAEDSGWTSWFGHAGDDMSGAFLGGTGVGANTTNSIHIAMFVAGGVVILYVVMR